VSCLSANGQSCAGLKASGSLFATEVYALEHLGRHLIHAPLLETTLLVNPAMAALVQRLRRAQAGEVGEQERRALEPLRALGLLGAERVPVPRAEIEEAPTEVTLLLTERCNLRCTYCYARGGEGGRTMPWPVARAAVRQVMANALRRGEPGVAVHFHGGGEVSQAWGLLRRIRREAAEQAEANHLRVHFSAGLNGVMSAKRAREASTMLDDATLSMDGVPEVHDRQRPCRGGRPTSALVLRTFGVLDAASLSYGIRVTVTPEATDRLPESVDFLCRHSAAHAIQVEPVYPHGRHEGRQVPDPTAFVTRYREAKAVARRHDRALRYSGARYPEVSDVFCRAVTGAYAVNPAGVVTSCFEAADERDPRSAAFVYGRYDPARDDFDLDAERRRGLLAFTVRNRPGCQDCLCKYHCAGDCAYKASGRAGEMRCIINRELTKDLILEALGEMVP